ncbi:hypothetical protein FRD01_09890 [Microvenator marinus]|uniref:Mechanosensitive ion channel n=1 Tax=Microvenator marinus TaxID=2600177 RepID=A0A5B8XUY8_9DELT|nr:hypothetical protein [Microvenator marinus]QED27546.1 hypothetical protein FRD01_09890 [Microvenator marinus]
MIALLWSEWIGHWPTAWFAWLVLLCATLFEIAYVRVGHTAPHLCRHRYTVALRTVLLVAASLMPLVLLGHILEAKSFGLILLGSMLLVFGFSTWLKDILLTVVIAFDQRLRASDDPHDAGTLRIGPHEGVVEGFRLGRIVLRDPNGALYAIPSRLWFEHTVSVPGEGFGDAVCEVIFEIENPGDLEFMRETLRFLSMTSIYASPRHRPDVYWLGSEGATHRFRVSTFASRSQLKDHFVADIQERFRAWKLELEQEKTEIS